MLHNKRIAQGGALWTKPRKESIKLLKMSMWCSLNLVSIKIFRKFKYWLLSVCFQEVYCE